MLANSFLLTPYLKALCEIDLLCDEGITMPNGVLDYTRFTSGPKKKIEYEKLKKVKSLYRSELYAQCSEIIMPVNKFKTDVRGQIKSRWEEQRSKLEALGRERKMDERYGNFLAQQINHFTLIRLLHDYKHSLVHVSCRQLQQKITESALRVELMQVTHRELKPRLNYSAGLPPEYHIFKIEDSHSQGTDHPFLQIDSLRTSTSVFGDLYAQGEGALPAGATSTIPSLKSILTLAAYPQQYKEKLVDVFELHKPAYDYDAVNLDLLVYRNLTS